MKYFIQKALSDWAYRVNDGCPDPRNRTHIQVLESVLRQYGCTEDFISEYVSRVYDPLLRESDEDEKYFHKGQGVYVKLGDKDKEDATKYQKTDDGKYKEMEGEQDSEDTREYTKNLLNTPEPGSDAASDKEKQDKKSSKIIKTPEEKQKQQLKNTLDRNIRVTNPSIKSEMDADDASDNKQLSELSQLKNTLKMKGTQEERRSTLVAIGHLYGKRSNSGFGKNVFGEVDVEQLSANKDSLLELYDDAKPELVEQGVRAVRKYKVSEEFVDSSYNSLPSSLKSALNGKGKVGDADIKPVGGHFLGYKKSDGSITSDVNDDNIIIGDDGKKEVVRGNVGNKSRGKLVWRIYLEQGGIDAYTGLPLDLESMDLEHVVGFKNSDKGEPTTQNYADREHEANHVLCSSKANQNKSDLSMDEFYNKQVAPLLSKTPEEFQQLEKGIEKANLITPRTEQTALRLMADPVFELKGGGTTTDPSDPNIKTTDLGTPKVKEAVLSENITPESIEKEFDYEDDQYSSLKETLIKDISDPGDVKKIKGLKTKIGKRSVNALGLPGGIPDPSGRRTNSISGSDNFYRGFMISMAEASPNEREKYKEGWKEAAKIAGSPEVRAQGRSAQSLAFVKHLRENGLISERVLNNKKYSKLFRYQDEGTGDMI